MRLRMAPLALLFVAAMWGTTFVMMKDAIQRQDVTSFLFTRFSVAVIAMIILRPKVLKLLSRDLLTHGSLIGTFLGTGFILQTLGLARTTAATTGFVTGLYVVVTPILAALVFRERITPRIWVYIAIATFGLAILSIHDWVMGTGELLVLASAFAFAAHIVALSHWSAGRDAYALTVVQLATAALLSGLASLRSGYQLPPDEGVWGVVVFTAIFATAFAFMIQTWAQARMSSTKVAVILTMEVVFAAFFAVLFGGEKLTIQLALGGILVMSAMFLIVLQEA